MGQWDGKDNSLLLDDNGLGGIDFTVNSTNGNTCDREVTIPGGAGENDYFLNFSSFTGNRDFTDVGGIEILVEAFDNVDSTITLVATNGLEDNSPSRTPTRTPSSSFVPSPSRTPSPSQVACYCEVPVFRCEQVFERNEFIQGVLGAPPGDITSFSSYYTSFSSDSSNSPSSGSSSATMLAPLAIFALLVALLL